MVQNRLKAWANPKNNIVDITNYIFMSWDNHCTPSMPIKSKENNVKTLPKDTPFNPRREERKLHEEDYDLWWRYAVVYRRGLWRTKFGVTEHTTRIFLECAYFDAVSIRKTAKRHGLNTDASFRYERGIDPEIGEFALNAQRLIKELAGGEITSDIVNIAQPLQEKAFVFGLWAYYQSLGQEILKMNSLPS